MFFNLLVNDGTIGKTIDSGRKREMAEVLIFHHALGLTKGIHIFADKLREEGHTVHIPDLFDGYSFTSIEEGMAYVKEIGFEEIIKRSTCAASGLPRSIVYMGFSLGVVPAQKLAQTREGARGALFFYSCVPSSMFGTPWPADLPVQIHGMDADPYFVEEGDLEAARELVASANHADLYLYPGDQHYFADSSLSSYDADATALLMQRVLEFLRHLDK
ncbi:dienelactone hydrolase family protein [Paenibacillus timonensis]|uniref:Dienelactone hydrolase family protein n=1 Tax=Paenibacillus timonensis TaxID=225915 RepID=A0ABW3SJT2_9BACL|nr:dienelactone hydrolase family protein [Paenibacillus timonensis]